MSAAEPILPPQFDSLLPFVDDWALSTERERYAKREASRFEDIKTFYDAGIARVEEATDYLDTVPLDALKPEDKRLMWLLFSLITVAFAVEVFKQPKVPDAGVAKLLSIGDPLPI